MNINAKTNEQARQEVFDILEEITAKRIHVYTAYTTALDKLAFVRKLPLGCFGYLLSTRMSNNEWRSILRSLIDRKVLVLYARPMHLESGRLSTLRWIEFTEEYEYYPLWGGEEYPDGL